MPEVKFWLVTALITCTGRGNGCSLKDAVRCMGTYPSLWACALGDKNCVRALLKLVPDGIRTNPLVATGADCSTMAVAGRSWAAMSDGAVNSAAPAIMAAAERP